MMLISRVRTIKQWFNALDPKTGCVHGSVIEVGANTHRMSHNSPNMANISKVKGKKVDFETLDAFNDYLKTIPEIEIMEVNEAKKQIEHLSWGEEADFRTDMRACWVSRDPKKRKIVGVDLSGIQLRAFAHYSNSKEYMDQILSGDIHTYNRGILDKLCKEYAQKNGLKPSDLKYLQKNDKSRRNDAKTFIYAYLFGAGNKKVGSILEFAAAHQFSGGKFIREGFVTSIQGLEEFKAEIKEATKRGFMVALDGRLIKLPSEHFALSIYLQSFESIIMKYALVLAHKKLKEEGLDAILVAVVHDESQWDVKTEHAERLGQLVVECMEEAGRVFKSNIPITGEYKIGDNWAESH